MNQNQNKNWKIEVEEEDKIELHYPSKGTFLDLESICAMMNKFFKGLFVDFNGSFIDVIPNPNAQAGGYITTPILYFSEPDERKLRSTNLPRAFKPIVTEQYSAIGLQANALSRSFIKPPRVYEITEEGKNYFTDNFIFHTPGDGITYNYTNSSVEEQVTQAFGSNVARATRVKTWGFDLVLILQKFIKDLNDDSIVTFTPVGIVPSSMPNATNVQNTLFKIDVSNMEEYQKIGDKYHIGVIQNVSLNAGPIITV